jgi:hypothetical protein
MTFFSSSLLLRVLPETTELRLLALPPSLSRTHRLREPSPFLSPPGAGKSPHAGAGRRMEAVGEPRPGPSPVEGEGEGLRSADGRAPGGGVQAGRPPV